MATSKELKEQLKKVDKTTISFDLPVLERIKLECLSFLSDEPVASANGADVKIGDVVYKLGVVNSYHHLSVGRALFRLIKSNPAVGQMVDKKKLSVRMIGDEVCRLTRYYKDQAYFKAQEKGYGFESLQYHRIPDNTVDVDVLVEAIAFIKVAKPIESIEIFSQDEVTKRLRLEIAKVEKAEQEKQKAESDAKRAAINAKVGTKPGTTPAVPAEPEPVKPNRDDAKYSGLFADDEYTADMDEYEKKLAAWKSKSAPVKVKTDAGLPASDDDAVDVEDTDIDLEESDESTSEESD